MPEEFCEHCDLPRNQCAHSAPPRSRAADALVADGPTISARYGGIECVGCGDLIAKNDAITHTEDGWAHASEVVSARTDPGIFEGF